jgi:hypothetical protein
MRGTLSGSFAVVTFLPPMLLMTGGGVKAGAGGEAMDLAKEEAGAAAHREGLAGPDQRPRERGGADGDTHWLHARS